MELNWASEFLTSNYDLNKLKSYPKYYQYYIRIHYEINTLNIFQKKDNKRVLFVGSGPLPLSAIILVDKFNLTVTCMDKDEKAINTSREIFTKLGFSNTKFILNDILNYSELNCYDAIFIAQSVGQNKVEKGTLVDHLASHVKASQVLILRPPYALEELLISPFPEDCFDNFDLIKFFIETKDDFLYRYLLLKK